MIKGKLRAVLRRRVVLWGSVFGVGLVAATICSATLPSAAGSTGAPIPVTAADSLRAAVLQVASASGDAQPTSITAVATSREAALTDATPGDTVPGSAAQAAYLVVMVGDFTLTYASVPSGAALPTGRYLALVIDPLTLQIMDLGLSNETPPTALGTFGPVSDLTTGS